MRRALLSGGLSKCFLRNIGEPLTWNLIKAFTLSRLHNRLAEGSAEKALETTGVLTPVSGKDF